MIRSDFKNDRSLVIHSPALEPLLYATYNETSLQFTIPAHNVLGTTVAAFTSNDLSNFYVG